MEERDEVALLRDDDFSLTPQSEEAEARRRLEYERLQRLRASRVIRQDRIEELVVQRSSNVDARPWWRRAASVVGQTLVIVAVIVIWTTILGLLLSEDSSDDTRSGSVDADGEAPTDGDATEVLGTELEHDEAGPDRGSASTNASAAPGAVEAQPSRALGALPPIPIEFDGRCALEVDPDELTDLSSVWPWQFAECEYAPIDLDGVGAVWIVVVSSIDGVGTVPPNAPTIRGGEELGLLWSSHYPSLNEGWWVVYGGPYGSEADASRARSAIGGSSYIRRLSETDVER